MLKFSSKIGVKCAEKTRDVIGTNGYHFWIQCEKLVQKHSYFQKNHKGRKNLSLHYIFTISQFFCKDNSKHKSIKKEGYLESTIFSFHM